MGKIILPTITDVNDDELLLEYVKSIRIKSLQAMTEDEETLKNGSVARVVNEIASGLAQDVYKQRELRLKEEEVNATSEANEKIMQMIAQLATKRTETIASKKELPELPEDKKPELPETVMELNPQAPPLERILEEFKDD